MYHKFVPEMGRANITVKKEILRKLNGHKGLAHIVIIATKPDIIKQAPIIKELIRKGEFVIVGHTNQHYDSELSQTFLDEFGITPDFNLNIGGNITEKQSQIIHRLPLVLEKLKRPGTTFVPYTYADTTTASAAAMAFYLSRIPIAHVEAGLRTMMPEKKIFGSLLKNGNFDAVEYYRNLRECKWVKGSFEPFPEQFNTRSSAPCTALHLAPTQLNAANLAAEGYYKESIFTVGNTISDAIAFIKKQKSESRFLAENPVLLESGSIRVCVHRRENLGSLHRFKTIVESTEKLAIQGRPVLWVSLKGTEAAIRHYGLQKRFERLSKKCRNFVYTTTLPYFEAVATLESCSAVVTDSGGIQEEANILHVPCVTARFNSDRPETVFEGSNILAPPLKKETFSKIVEEVSQNMELNRIMAGRKSVYGKNVSKKIVELVGKAGQEGLKIFEEDRLGFSKMRFWEKGGMEW